MRIAVLGAGVAGVTTAYYLVKSGHEVVVIEQASKPGLGASGDNGGQLSWSFTDALASAAFLSKIPSVLVGRDQAVVMRPQINLQFLKWGLQFLSQCTGQRHRENTLNVLGLAMRSATLMARLREELSLQFDFRPAGKMVLLNGNGALENARASVSMKRTAGCEVDVIDMNRALELEPAIASFAGDYSGAIWSEHDQLGDTRAFTEGLARWLQDEAGVSFQFETQVDSIGSDESGVRSIRCNGQSVAVDAAVVCLGANSPELLRPMGIRMPIVPVRGYSISLPAGPKPPSASITEHSARIVFGRLNGKVRIAGFADFVGFNASRDSKRIETLLATARQVAPEAADYDAFEDSGWAGNRPLTPDSRPRTGATTVPGLFVNTGHGMLGWTLATATAEKVARDIGKD